MNISLDINRINIGNLFFLDTKRNIIMDGNFTKVLYSNEYFTMNGIYVIFPILVSNIEKNINKNIMKIHPYSVNNLSIIQDFAKLEVRILDYYKNTYRAKGKISNLLSRQLYSGSLKLYKEFNYHFEPNNAPKQYIIKISGVWESNDEIGLTYKVIEAG